MSFKRSIFLALNGSVEIFCNVVFFGVENITIFRGICATDRLVLKLMEPILDSLARAYLALYEEQDRQYFGLRDYYR